MVTTRKNKGLKMDNNKKIMGKDGAENYQFMHNLPINTGANEIIENILDSLKTELYTGLDDSQKPTTQDIADLINEVAKNGVTSYEEFSKFAGSTRFSHKNIVTSTEKRLDYENPFFFLFPYLEKFGIDEIKNKTLKKLITTLSKNFGIDPPKFLALSTYKLYGNVNNMAMTFDGELSINVKPALLDKKQRNFGFSLINFLNGLYHELEHRRQFTFTSELFHNNKKDIPQKYQFLAKFLFMEHSLKVAQAAELADVSYLSSFKYYFASLWEVDARITAAKEILNLLKNPDIDAKVKKQIYKDINILMLQIFGTKFDLFIEMQKYANQVVRDFKSTFGNIEFAKELLNSLPKDGVANLINEAKDIKNEMILMRNIYAKNNALNLKKQALQIKEEVINQANIANEILHKTPIIAKETLKAAKNLPSNTLYRLKIIKTNLRFILEDIREEIKKNKNAKTNNDKDREM